MKYLAIPLAALTLAGCAAITEQTGVTQAQQLCLALYAPDPDLSNADNARAALAKCLAPVDPVAE